MIHLRHDWAAGPETELAIYCSNHQTEKFPMLLTAESLNNSRLGRADRATNTEM